MKLTLRVFTSPSSKAREINRTKKNGLGISCCREFLLLGSCKRCLDNLYVDNGTHLLIFRENELLKHQLKKYVGAVQALRSDLQGKSSETVEGKQVSRDSNWFTVCSAVKFYF